MKAIYDFLPRAFTPRTLVYIHEDGDEHGAAGHLYVLFAHPSTGCLATQFIRGNAGAMLTESLTSHAPDYLYRVKGMTVHDATIEAERYLGDSLWEPVYNGTLAGFVERFGGKSLIRIDGRFPQFHTPEQLLKELETADEDRAQFLQSVLVRKDTP